MTPGDAAREPWTGKDCRTAGHPGRREAPTAAIAKPTPGNVPTNSHPHLPLCGFWDFELTPNPYQ
jgi:hypothetical protein